MMKSRMCASAKKAIQILGVGLAIILFFLPANAQLNYGRIFGEITDQSGGVVVGATVTVTDVERGTSRALNTDSAGQYSAPSLLPGKYTVRTEAKGFQVMERTSVIVEVGHEVRVDLVLQPGEQTQTITVSGEAALIDTTNAELGGTLEHQTLDELPISGRLFLKMLQFTPGVYAAPGGNSPSTTTNGTSTEGTNYIVDGVDDLDMYSMTGPVVGSNTSVDELNILPVDAIQEVNVIENPTGQYGWKVGAQVNVGLKSGTNSIHGTAFGLGRFTALDARNPFLLPQDPKGEDSYQQFGASIGGPIKKDKLFYFGSYEGQRFTIGTPSDVLIPTTASLAGDTSNSFPDAIADMNTNSHPLSPLSLAMAGCTAAGVCDASKGLFGNSSSSTDVPDQFPNSGGSDNYLIKFDYHLNDHNALNGEYYLGNSQSDTADGIQSYWEDFNHNRVQMVRGVWVWTPNSTWVNEARFGYERYDNINGFAECEQPKGSANTAAPPNYVTAFGFVSGVTGVPPVACGLPNITIGSFTQLGANGDSALPSAQAVLFGTWSGVDSVSYSRGKHAFKFGAEIHITRFDGFGASSFSTGSITFGSGTDAFPGATPLEDFLAGVPTSGEVLLGNKPLQTSMHRYAAFVQDDWRFTPRVSVNLGLRYEYVPAMAAANNAFGNFDPTSITGVVQQTNGNALYHAFNKAFSPRLGIAWDVTGKGTTVVRAGGSIIYDTLPLAVILARPQGGFLPGVPTGFTFVAPDGSTMSGPGNIDIGAVNLAGSAASPTGSGQLPWAQNVPVFNTTSSALQCGNGVGTNPAPCNIDSVNPNNFGKNYVSTWTVSIEHAFTSNLSANLAYVGNHGTDQPYLADINQPALGTSGLSNELGRRPFQSQFPWLGKIQQYTYGGNSSYNGLQASVIMHTSHGLTFMADYTYDHALAQNGGALVPTVMDSTNPHLDYGNSSTTPFQIFTLTATYVLPSKKSPLQVLEGWEVNTTLNLNGRTPFSAIDTSTDLAGTGTGTGTGDRWTLVGNPSDFNSSIGGFGTVPCFAAPGSRFAGACTIGLPAACVSAAAAEPVNASVPGSSGTASLNRFGCYMVGNSVIVPPAQGTYGNMSRSELTDRPFREWDLSASKKWKFGERFSLQFRAEFYNVLNHIEFAPPFGNFSAPFIFGSATGSPNSSNPINGTGGPREVQLGLRMVF